MAKLGLRADRSMSEGIRAFARDILDEADKALTRRDSADAVVVHDFRKAMKRWRAFLRLMPKIVGSDAEWLRHAARDLARELAEARDAHAALDALNDLARIEGSISPRTLATLRERLGRMRSEAESVALTTEMHSKMRAHVEESSRAVTKWQLDEAAFSDIADGLTASYRRARKLIPNDWKTIEDEPLHELRSRVVVQRYQMPLIQPLWPRYSKLWAKETQRLREILGAHQDITVLAKLTAPGEPLSRWRAVLAPVIAARKAAHVETSAKMAERLFVETPKAFRARLLGLWKSSRPEH
jgi:CHAD domain-containing protein